MLALGFGIVVKNAAGEDSVAPNPVIMKICCPQVSSARFFNSSQTVWPSRSCGAKQQLQAVKEPLSQTRVLS